MRHLGSLLLSLVLTVVWYALLGLGGVYYLHNPRSTTHTLALAGALLGAGLLYGLLLLLRLSPVGLVVTGALLLVLGAWTLFVDSKGPFEYLPTDLLGQEGALVYPVQDTVFAAVPLLMTVFSPRRWRRYANPRPAANAYSPTPPVPVPTAAPEGGYPPPGGYGAPAGGYGTPADPYGTPVSPAAGPEGTRVMPAPAAPSSGGPSYPPPSSGAGSYPPPSGPSYPPPSGGSYAAPSSGSGYGAPSSAGGYPPPSAYPASPPAAGPAPVWPSGPGAGRDDPDATRPI